MFIGNEASDATAGALTARLVRMSQCLEASSLIFAELLRAELKLLRGLAGWMALLSQLVREAPRWKTYLSHVADLPDLPAPTATVQFLGDAGLEQRTPRSRARRLVLLAAGTLLLGGTGLIAWKAGALARPTELKEWMMLVGGLLGTSLLGGLVTWRGKRWLRARLGL